MKKISLLFLLIFNLGIAHINANGEDLEKIYLDGGYKEINEALNETNVFFEEVIPLPTTLPAVEFTHVFARFITIESPKLEISFLNENYGETHYKIFVTSLKYRQEFGNEENISKIKLKDGSEAIYLIKENFSLFIFEKRKFQYTLMIDNKSLEKVKNEGLIQIANSI